MLHLKHYPDLSCWETDHTFWVLCLYRAPADWAILCGDVPPGVVKRLSVYRTGLLGW